MLCFSCNGSRIPHIPKAQSCKSFQPGSALSPSEEVGETLKKQALVCFLLMFDLRRWRGLTLIWTNNNGHLPKPLEMIKQHELPFCSGLLAPQGLNGGQLMCRFDFSNDYYYSLILLSAEDTKGKGFLSTMQMSQFHAMLMALSWCLCLEGCYLVKSSCEVQYCIYFYSGSHQMDK